MLRKGWLATVVGLCVFAGLIAGCKSNGNGGGTELEPVPVISEEDEPLIPWSKPPGERVEGVLLENVLFSFDSSQIGRGERHKIEAAVQHFKRNRRRRVIIEGHCDERGSREYNMSLGERRALAVRDYMIGLGIDAGRILTKSYGEEQPLDPGHNETAWRSNRRAEFAIYR